MLVKEFLKRTYPGVKVTIFDLDKELGKNKKSDEAGALAVEYHFNNAAEVVDFIINSDEIILYIKRK